MNENKAKRFAKHTAVRRYQCIACVYLFLFAGQPIGWRTRRSCYSGWLSTAFPVGGSKNTSGTNTDKAPVDSAQSKITALKN